MAADAAFQFVHIGLQSDQGGVVLFHARQFEQFPGVGDGLTDLLQVQHHAFQQFLLAAQFLGLLRLIPEGRIFVQPVDFVQSVLLVLVVKDTP